MAASASFGQSFAGGWFARDAQIFQRVGAALLPRSRSQEANFQQVVIAKDAFALADKDAADALLQVLKLRLLLALLEATVQILAIEEDSAKEWNLRLTSCTRRLILLIMPQRLHEHLQCVLRHCSAKLLPTNECMLGRIAATSDRLYLQRTASLKMHLDQSVKTTLGAKKQASAPFKSGFRLSALFR